VFIEVLQLGVQSLFGSNWIDMTEDIVSINSGRCRCGKYRFRVFGEPFWVSYCHCSDCRKATGAPVAVFAGFKSDEVKLFGEKATTYKSIPEVKRLFCSRCGTPIGYQDARLPGEIYYYIGVLEEQSKVVPQLHAWISERLDWLSIADDLPRYQHFSRPR
jgi:hypothetical protein|tara:strand:+ start:20059 stop:20538 length:480 start_codon:yes stop_codon:yes gene_type:complete